MREDRKQARMCQIEEAAYGLLTRLGYEGTTMLAVAKAAKASNETMYRWYGDKNGLFLAMVRANAMVVSEAIGTLAKEDVAPLQMLTQLAPVLLGLLTGERAIALNRAAASDASGALGGAIDAGGRSEVLPVLQQLMARAVAQGELRPPEQGELGPLFMHLLVGDRQIRRVIGTLPPPTPAEVQAQAAVAMAQFRGLCGVRD